MRLVLFDLDGTLVDGQHTIIACFRMTFPAFGLSVPADDAIRRIIGRSLEEAIHDLGCPTDRVIAVADGYRRNFQLIRARPGHDEALYPGADSMVRHLAARDDLRLGTATGKALRGIHWLIAKKGWQGLFHVLQGADTAASKPSPEMVLNACHATGIAPEQTFVVGDSVHDMRMARSAGARAIAVRWGYGEADQLVAAGAHAVIDDFGALPALLDR
jgi:phosphoglycolate phosphatase